MHRQGLVSRPAATTPHTTTGLLWSLHFKPPDQWISHLFTEECLCLPWIKGMSWYSVSSSLCLLAGGRGEDAFCWRREATPLELSWRGLGDGGGLGKEQKEGGWETWLLMKFSKDAYEEAPHSKGCRRQADALRARARDDERVVLTGRPLSIIGEVKSSGRCHFDPSLLQHFLCKSHSFICLCFFTTLCYFMISLFPRGWEE